MRLLFFKKRETSKRQQIARYRKEMRASGALRHKLLRAKFALARITNSIKIAAPKYFSLINTEQRNALLSFIESLYTGTRSGKHVTIDFRDTTELRPCGTLYFVANVETLLAVYPNRLSCKLPPNDIVEQLFQHIGLLTKLGQSSSLKITADNVVKWHYATGTDASTTAFSALLTEHGEALGGLVARSKLYDCMSEAITNARKHAYPLYNDNETQWWMFSQMTGNKLTVVICDLGIGIPASLMHKPEIADYVRKLLIAGSEKKHDRQLVEVAINSTRTSSRLPYRGKGLPQMRALIANENKGEFRVQSGHGYYYYVGEKRKFYAGSYSKPIIGTTVQWTLSLIS